MHRWKVDPCPGERLRSDAVTGVVEEISIPVGAFFKVPSLGLHLQTSNTFRTFVSLRKPHKSANLKEKPRGQA